MKKILFLVFAGLIFAACNKPVEDLTNKVFLNEIPKDDFAALTLEDFPSYSAGYSRGVAVGENSFYVVSDPYVLNYAFDGTILSYANPKVLTCGVAAAVVGEKLFVACRQEGIYEIDLNKNEIVYNYTKADGLEEYQNPNFAVQGKTLWVGTFDGVAKINTETRKVRFYDELNFPGSHLGATVYVNGDSVWATIAANAYNSGSAGYYNSGDDTWTTFGIKDFKKTDLDRVDFERFVVSSEGVFASFQDGGPANTVLTKFDPTSQTWNEIYSAGWGEFGENVAAHLPQPSTYTDYEIEYSYENPLAKFTIYRDGSSIVGVPTFLALSPLIKDTYYLLSSTGIYSFSEEDAFPKLVVEDRFPGRDSRFFVSDGDKYLVILSANVNEMGGGTNSYAVQVLNLKDKGYYLLEIDAGKLAEEDLFQVSDKIQMKQDGQKMYVELTSGKKLTLDLDAKTFGVN